MVAHTKARRAGIKICPHLEALINSLEDAIVLLIKKG